MNLVYYSSDFFSEMLGVSIQSLCENNENCDEVNIYVIEEDISENNRARLKCIVETYHRNLIFIKMPMQEEFFPDVKINLGRTYARMILGELLPESVDRVISCDSDTLILDSIEEIYNTKLGDNWVAGVYDCVGKAIQINFLHQNSDLIYCNAGMFLIDLVVWRKENITKKLLNVVMEAADGKQPMYFLEQDLLNIVFYNKVKLLHPRYNLLTSIYMFDYNEVVRMKKPVIYYTEEEVEEAKRRPAIIHATTCFYVRKRMWVDGSDHPYAEWYQKYRSKTPWKDDQMIIDSRKPLKKIYSQFWHIMPRSIAIALASLTINYIRPLFAKITFKASLPTIAQQSST